MKLNWKPTIVIMLFVLIPMIGFIGVKSRDEQRQERKHASQPVLPPQTHNPVSEAEKPQHPYDFTASHMDQYAAEEGAAQDDVQAVGMMLESAFMMMKDQMPSFSGNQELVMILQGNNPSGMKFLSSSFPYLDHEGQLLDRWRKPLFFHRIRGSIIDVRSAGPDGIMWNQDDVHTAREPETAETLSE